MNVFHTLQELFAFQKNARLNPRQMNNLQNKKLRTLLHYSWEHSPYYRQSFKQAGLWERDLDTAPLSAFPAVDKVTLMEHFDEILTVPEVTQAALRQFDENQTLDRKPYLSGQSPAWGEDPRQGSEATGKHGIERSLSPDAQPGFRRRGAAGRHGPRRG